MLPAVNVKHCSMLKALHWLLFVLASQNEKEEPIPDKT